MPRKALYPDNSVAEAIMRCGGLSRAAKVMKVSRTTIWRWRTEGKINKFDAAILLAKEIEWPVERLIPKAIVSPAA